jgi:hypothetical protein
MLPFTDTNILTNYIILTYTDTDNILIAIPGISEPIYWYGYSPIITIIPFLDLALLSRKRFGVNLKIILSTSLRLNFYLRGRGFWCQKQLGVQQNIRRNGEGFFGGRGF